MVNQDFIAEYTYETVRLTDGEELSISRPYRKELRGRIREREKGRRAADWRKTGMLTPITEMTEQEIREIGDAFADYVYEDGEEGMFSIFGSREKVSRYICAFARAALRCGWMWAVGENREGFLAVRSSDNPVPASIMAGFLWNCLRILGLKEAFYLAKSLNAGGRTLEESMKKAKQPFMKIEMLCIRKPYQGQGHMREALEAVFRMADEKKVSCILDTDGRLKMEKYCHFGMRLVRTRRITETIRMYDLLREPEMERPENIYGSFPEKDVEKPEVS